MAEIVLDANVLVGLFDRNDTLHQAAVSLIDRLTAAGEVTVLLDFCLAEALSVLCRRARDRKSAPPDLQAIFREVRRLHDAGKIEHISEPAVAFGEVLDVMAATGGAMNFNDAQLFV